MSQLILNRIQTPDGTILTSRTTHDYQSHREANGDFYYVDGGLSYQRYGGTHLDKIINLALYTTDPHKKIREHYTWGTFGKDGNQPLKYILLKDLDSAHIKAILQTKISPIVKTLMENELLWRYTNDNSLLL